MATTITYDVEKGPDIPQGDLLLTFLGHAEFGTRWIGKEPAGDEIGSTAGRVRILEGELSGHHHDVVGPARLIADSGLLSDLIRSGEWHDRYRGLHIGFLVVSGEAADLIHPEHDTWRLPAGVYACGRQVESAGAEERAVLD